MSTVSSNKVEFGKICSVANKLRKEKGISQKEAFALAKQMIASKQNAAPVQTAVMSKADFVKALKKGSVKFTFVNRRGVKNTTKGTLCQGLITKTYKPAGRMVTTDADSVVFYDRIHGVYRTVKMENLVQVY